MDKLLEIKIGGGTVRSGWVPLSAMGMIRDLLEAIAEEGVDEEIWRSLDPQVEVLGKRSTLVAIHTNFANKLRPQVRSFREKGKRHRLGPKGQQFVQKHVTPVSHWSYIQVIECPPKKEKSPPPESARILRFDLRYRERLLAEQPKLLHGFDEIYAVIKRAGGDDPTVSLEIQGGRSGTFKVRGNNRRELAKRIAGHLYETVKLKIEGWWNPRTLQLEDLHVHDLLEWRDLHMAQVYREHGRLPIRLTVNSVEELMADREEDRE